jgi:hypothetical protein
LIEWSEAWYRGAEVTDHIVQIKTKANAWIDMAQCTGAGLSCSIDMLTLQVLTQLDFNDPIQIRITAINLIGQSLWSDINTDETIRQIPGKMHNPSRGALTSESQIHVKWLPLEGVDDTGNSPILAYQLMFDN